MATGVPAIGPGIDPACHATIGIPRLANRASSRLLFCASAPHRMSPSGLEAIARSNAIRRPADVPPASNILSVQPIVSAASRTPWATPMIPPLRKSSAMKAIRFPGWAAGPDSGPAHFTPCNVALAMISCVWAKDRGVAETDCPAGPGGVLRASCGSHTNRQMPAIASTGRRVRLRRARLNRLRNDINPSIFLHAGLNGIKPPLACFTCQVTGRGGRLKASYWRKLLLKDLIDITRALELT